MPCPCYANAQCPNAYLTRALPPSGNDSAPRAVNPHAEPLGEQPADAVMGGGGGGDRPGAAPTRRAGDDRPPAIRAVIATLFDFVGDPIARVTMVLAADLPEVVMFAGEPFLLDVAGDGDRLAYVQSRPYRADGSMVKELRP